MDDVRVGRIARALRRRRGWTQAHLASATSVAQSTVSLLERGQLEGVSLATVRRILRELEAQVQLGVLWRGSAVEQLLDEGHARLVAAIVARLHALGWETAVEVTYAVFGERGSIDVVGWRGLDRSLLVVEVKRELASAEGTLRKHDEKIRLGRGIVRERFGWDAHSVSRLLVLPDTGSARRRVAGGDGLIARSYPLNGVALRRWLTAPSGSISGLLFLPNIDLTVAKQRIRTRSRSPTA